MLQKLPAAHPEAEKAEISVRIAPGKRKHGAHKQKKAGSFRFPLSVRIVRPDYFPEVEEAEVAGCAPAFGTLR